MAEGQFHRMAAPVILSAAKNLGGDEKTRSFAALRMTAPFRMIVQPRTTVK
mgnify:CR=1 FL=1